MTNEELAKAIRGQLVVGRKLWMGLHSSDTLRASSWLVEEPHCTLAHFGGSVEAEPVLDAAREVAATFGAMSPRVSGLARFSTADAEGNPVVALLQDVRIRLARERALSVVAWATQSALDQLRGPYDYTPHVTLCRVRVDHPVSLSSPSGLSHQFTHVGVTCGSAHGRWPLVG